ncbi:MAG TPA: HAD hydrolase-like protein [Spirochaetota bacterium]|nr:HAD hydrolase-like protein [Spirochaetota bacterium]
MSIFKNIIFDLDGTLTDPGVGITRSVSYALNKFGISEKTENLYKFIGPPLRDSFTKYYGFSREKAEEAVLYYREYFSETGIFENEVYPGIPALLSELKKSGRNLYLATTKPIIYAEKILHHFDLHRYFTSTAGSNLDGSNGEKSVLIAGLIKGYGITEFTRAVMVGDRKYDIEGARANGIASVGVAYGYAGEGELEESMPDYIAETVTDLKKFLLNS